MAFKRNLIIASASGALALASTVVGHFEGTENKTYLDPVGIPTICTGHTGPEVKIGMTLSDAECETLLAGDLGEAFSAVDRRVTVPMPDTRRAALASFVYNVGAGKFASSTLLKKLNAGDTHGACNELGRWVYAGGRKLAGLVKRRAVERELCLQGLGTRVASREISA